MISLIKYDKVRLYKPIKKGNYLKENKNLLKNVDLQFLYENCNEDISYQSAHLLEEALYNTADYISFNHSEQYIMTIKKQLVNLEYALKYAKYMSNLKEYEKHVKEYLNMKYNDNPPKDQLDYYFYYNYGYQLDLGVLRSVLERIELKPMSFDELINLGINLNKTSAYQNKKLAINNTKVLKMMNKYILKKPNKIIW